MHYTWKTGGNKLKKFMMRILSQFNVFLFFFTFHFRRYDVLLLNKQVSYSRRPWDEHDSEANGGQLNLFAKTKKNVGNLSLSLWKTIETLKKARCRNF